VLCCLKLCTAHLCLKSFILLVFHKFQLCLPSTTTQLARDVQIQVQILRSPGSCSCSQLCSSVKYICNASSIQRSGLRRPWQRCGARAAARATQACAPHVRCRLSYFCALLRRCITAATACCACRAPAEYPQGTVKQLKVFNFMVRVMLGVCMAYDCR